jgi:hypothetical protein
MKKLFETNKIIWAVDPFSDRVMLQRSAAWAIYELTQKNPSSVIQPVYMVNDWPADIVPQRHVRSFVEKLEAFGNDSLKRILYRIPLENIKPLQVISRPFESIEQGARELITTAKHQGFHLIVASTRANRGGKSPFALPGSFVEMLSDLSDLPVFIVNPHWRHATGIASLLFPTDLSQESFDWYLRTLEFAKTKTAKVTLFHKIDFPLSQPFEVASQIFPEIRNNLFKKVRASQIEAKKWVQIAKERGVKLSLIVDSRMIGSLSEAVMVCLEKHPGSVIISPPLSVTYPRSTIRRLLRYSPFPIFLIPKFPSKAAPIHAHRKAA